MTICTVSSWALSVSSFSTRPKSKDSPLSSPRTVTWLASTSVVQSPWLLLTAAGAVMLSTRTTDSMSVRSKPTSTTTPVEVPSLNVTSTVKVTVEPYVIRLLVGVAASVTAVTSMVERLMSMSG